MLGDAPAHAQHHRRVDAGAADDHLPLAQARQLAQQVAAHALHRRGDAVLVDGVGDAHDALGHALAEHVAVELARPLGDQPDADAELAPLAQDRLEHLGADRIGVGRRVVVRLFQQAEDGVGHERAVAGRGLALGRVHARLVDPPQQRGDDHLLLAAIHLVQLDHRALARFEEFVQFQVLEVVEDAAVAQ